MKEVLLKGELYFESITKANFALFNCFFWNFIKINTMLIIVQSWFLNKNKEFQTNNVLASKSLRWHYLSWKNIKDAVRSTFGTCNFLFVLYFSRFSMIHYLRICKEPDLIALMARSSPKLKINRTPPTDPCKYKIRSTKFDSTNSNLS